MKKPVKKTKAEIDRLVAKAVVRQVVHEQNIKSGTLAEVKQEFEDFAKKYNVKVDEVRLVQGWGKAYFKVKADETSAQVRQRVEYSEDRKYRSAAYKYQNWKYTQDQQRVQAAAQAKVVNTACCPTNCCCRR